MSQDNIIRKKWQLKGLVAELQHLLRNHHVEAGARIEKLIQKIKSLAHELGRVLSQTELKKILGVAAILIGVSFSNKAEAQSFAPPVANPFGLVPVNYYAFPAFADLDADGDQDLLVGEYEGVLKYFQNTGTSLIPQFANPIRNPFGLLATTSLAIPAFADLDGDGDTDVLLGAYYGSMEYFQNIGSSTSPQFAAPIVNPFGLDSTYLVAIPAFTDLDADGDFDLLVGEAYGAMQYFQNTGSGTSPEFAAPIVNPFGLDSTNSLAFPAFADLDHDGDTDLLVGEYYGAMKYFRNTGSAQAPQFAAPLTNPFGLGSTYYYAIPAFADLDGDSDMDLLVGEYEGVMQYFENLSTVGISDLYQSFNLSLFPNPVQDILKIDSDEKIDKIEIFNIKGENVITIANQVSQISLHHLIPGIYIVKVTSDKGNFTAQKIKKQ